MKIRSILVIPAMLATNLYASEGLVTCDIQSIDDARLCMDREAEAQPTNEGANVAIASTRMDLLVKVLELLSRPETERAAARNANFVGAMIVDDYEPRIVYYALKTGRGQKPTVVYDLNTVDLGSTLEDLGAEIPDDPSMFFLGDAAAQENDLYQNLDEILAEARSN